MMHIIAPVVCCLVLFPIGRVMREGWSAVILDYLFDAGLAACGTSLILWITK